MADHVLKPMAGTSGVLLLAAGLLAAYIIYEIFQAVHIAFFGPLSKIPGPLLRKFSNIPYARAVGNGYQHTDTLALHEKYGPVVRTAPKIVLFASGREAWKDIYGFRKNGTLPKDKLFYGMAINGGYSVATAGALDHQRQRKIFSNAFSDRALREQETMIKSWAAKFSSKLRKQAEGKLKTDMLKWYNCTTFDVMADLTFGEPLHMLEESEYTPWVKKIFEGIKIGTRIRCFKYLGPLAQYIIDDVLMKTEAAKKGMLEHYNYSSKRVDRRLEKGATKPDIWSLVEGKEKEHGGLTRAEHHANGNVFMIAGTETTATALSGITYFLCKNPEAMQRLVKEVRDEFDSIDDLKMESLARLKYMHAVLEEGLRLYPPVPIDLPRVVPGGGATIDGIFLPEGTRLGVGQYATYRSALHFKNPLEFRPERWLGEAEYKDDNFGVFEPFSIGPRNCLGKNLAYHEMRILLATVMLDYDVTLLEESDHWVDRQHVYTLWEKKPLWCNLTLARA